MTISQHHEIIEDGTATRETRVATTRLVVSPGQAVSAALGLFVAIIGVIAIYRSGLDGSLNVPVVRAGFFDQSAMLGLAELALGLALVVGAASYATRSVSGGVGVLMIVGGVILAAGGKTILRDVGTTHATGWAIMVGGIIVLAAASLGQVVRTQRKVERI